MQSIHPIERNAFILDSHHNIARDIKKVENSEKRTVILATILLHHRHCRRSALNRDPDPNAIQLGQHFAFFVPFILLFSTMYAW